MFRILSIIALAAVAFTGFTAFTLSPPARITQTLCPEQGPCVKLVSPNRYIDLPTCVEELRRLHRPGMPTLTDLRGAVMITWQVGKHFPVVDMTGLPPNTATLLRRMREQLGKADGEYMLCLMLADMAGRHPLIRRIRRALHPHWAVVLGIGPRGSCPEEWQANFGKRNARLAWIDWMLSELDK